MADKKFNVSIDGNELEDLTLDSVVEMLVSKKASASDYVYNEDQEDWQMILENQEIMKAFKAQAKPIRKPKVKVTKAKEETEKKTKEKENADVKATDFSKVPNNPMLSEWYVLKGENKFGPFPYTDVIKMLQEKVIFEFDFAWQNGMESWVRIAEIKEFCPEHIKGLQDSLMPEIKNVFFRRKHPRVPFEGTIVVHNNQQVWKGQAVELSEGGAGLIMENSMIIPGQKLFMHFKPENGMPAFNAICEVVSKKFVDNVKKKKAPICYGVKFTNISGDTQKHLQDFTKTNYEQAA